MRILRQLGIILGFGFLGEIISFYLPMGLPASVLGLALMLSALGFRLLKPEQLGETADFISTNMAFFFLPAAVTVLENYGVIKPILLQLLLIAIISTVTTFFITYFTVRVSRMLLGKRV
ncbi:murein hydrolase exporter [Treponema primitia ZAS-2]|uniref:Murein hydrolase exporter n=1 Tax=Treponema primitia (strain ATCC BAA-887 / DSM 12427 / ZAS-2) TaxID=545694 RepID=F5YKX7_TREPZ|nr:CidA/LrgA family protein [Treponema primitia]AEF85668.1 murein hydrolase exporter [Treponema primitia ZAS-2]